MCPMVTMSRKEDDEMAGAISREQQVATERYQKRSEVLARIHYAAVRTPEPLRSYLMVTHAMTRQDWTTDE